MAIVHRTVAETVFFVAVLAAVTFLFFDFFLPFDLVFGHENALVVVACVGPQFFVGFWQVQHTSPIKNNSIVFRGHSAALPDVTVRGVCGKVEVLLEKLLDNEKGHHLFGIVSFQIRHLHLLHTQVGCALLIPRIDQFQCRQFNINAHGSIDDFVQIQTMLGDDHFRNLYAVPVKAAIAHFIALDRVTPYVQKMFPNEIAAAADAIDGIFNHFVGIPQSGVFCEHHCRDSGHVIVAIEKNAFATRTVATRATTFLVEILHTLADRVVNDESHVWFIDSPAIE